MTARNASWLTPTQQNDAYAYALAALHGLAALGVDTRTHGERILPLMRRYVAAPIPTAELALITSQIEADLKREMRR